VKGDLVRNLRRLAVLVLVASAVTGCGRKGSLEPAPSASAKAGAQGEEQKADQPAGGISGLRAKKPPPVTPPKTPSILDPILE